MHIAIVSCVKLKFVDFKKYLRVLISSKLGESNKINLKTVFGNKILKTYSFKKTFRLAASESREEKLSSMRTLVH